MESLDNGGVEWNFTNTIKRGQTQESPPSSTSEEGEGEGEGVGEGNKKRGGVEDTRRRTLTEEELKEGQEEEDESEPLRLEIDETAFVIGDRSSLVIGEGGSDTEVGGGGREGGEGGKVCVLQEPERTRGDGQEADKRLESPPSTSLHNIILPLLSRVSHVITHVIVT